jgi:oligopeptide/dipeptide ABC transporter ATP-binding protein
MTTLTAPPPAPLVAVDGLALTDAAGTLLVHDATLTARRGEVLGIVGESGSGKSLTLRAIAGLLPEGVRVAAGRVDVDGDEITGMTAARLRRYHAETMGMVFQEPMVALNPTMVVGDQIAEAVSADRASTRGQRRRRALELIERVGLTDPERRYHLYPHELSGGMRQRIVIAIALAGEPELLLCDEPTTALDATVTTRILDMLLGLVAERSIGVVFVTHDLGVAARVCDRIAVMYAGKVLEQGPVDEILQRPRHPYTLALLQAVPTRDRTIDQLRAIPGNPPSPGEARSGCPFASRCPIAEPECETEAVLDVIADGHATACRRHEMLAVTEGAVHV